MKIGGQTTFTHRRHLDDRRKWPNAGLLGFAESTLMHLATRDFLMLLDTQPAFARMLILIQGQRIRELLTWVEALTKLSAEGRLAERLLLFPQREASRWRAG